MPLHLQSHGEADSQSSSAISRTRAWSVALALLSAACLVVSSGCIALSIPSKRFHDPNDHGGLFGDFRRGGSAGESAPLSEYINESCDDESCVVMHGEELSYEDCDDDAEFGHGSHHSKPPNIPWPRYHPVPTRPVFSGFPGTQP